MGVSPGALQRYPQICSARRPPRAVGSLRVVQWRPSARSALGAGGKFVWRSRALPPLANRMRVGGPYRLAESKRVGAVVVMRCSCAGGRVRRVVGVGGSMSRLNVVSSSAECMMNGCQCLLATCLNTRYILSKYIYIYIYIYIYYIYFYIYNVKK